MNIWNAFPFVRYSLALIFGIVVFSRYPALWDHPFIVFSSITILVLFTAFSFRKSNLNLFRILSGLFTLSLIAFTGGYLTRLHDQSSQIDHYLNVHSEIAAFSGLINSGAYEREQYFRYEMKLDRVIVDSTSREVSGSIYLYVKKDSLSHPIRYGTKLFVAGSFYKILAPRNPDEFDYQSYLAHKNIFAQSFVSEQDIKSRGEAPSNFLLGEAYRLRSLSSQMITDYIPGHQESAVLNALLIGVKDYLDNEIKGAYSAAGAMHVLAVSGLHVGIVYLLVSIVFGSMKNTTWGKVIFLFLSLSIIWCYALITGFSPSVLRASTMFSIIIIGETSRRKANIYNSLGIAAFILLLYNPFFIYEVGFQLSFIAVFGIVMFQPPIYRLWEPSNKVLDYIWAIVSVSIAAQLVTFPLSVYYFNQFPTYFLLSNLIVIPAAMVMLTTGLFMLGAGSISVIAGQTIGFLLGTFIHFINWLILWIQELPFPTVDWLYLSSLSVLLIYLFILYFFQGLSNYHYKYLVFSLVCLGVLFLYFNYKELQDSRQKRVVIYQTNSDAAIDLISGHDASLVSFGDSVRLENEVNYKINPHRLASGLEPVALSSGALSSNLQCDRGLCFLMWEGLRILIIGPEWKDELGGSMEVDILMLLKKEKHCIDQISTRFLVLGTMDSWWERKEMIAHLNEKKQVYHDLERDGYFELDLKDYAESLQPSIFVK